MNVSDWFSCMVSSCMRLSPVMSVISCTAGLTEHCRNIGFRCPEADVPGTGEEWEAVDATVNITIIDDLWNMMEEVLGGTICQEVMEQEYMETDL